MRRALGDRVTHVRLLLLMLLASPVLAATWTGPLACSDYRVYVLDDKDLIIGCVDWHMTVKDYTLFCKNPHVGKVGDELFVACNGASIPPEATHITPPSYKPFAPPIPRIKS